MFSALGPWDDLDMKHLHSLCSASSKRNPHLFEHEAPNHALKRTLQTFLRPTKSETPQSLRIL